jgi:hypothetical protein
MKFKEFAKQIKRSGSVHGGQGGSGKFSFINRESAALRARGHSRNDFRCFRRTWAHQYDHDLSKPELEQVLKEKREARAAKKVMFTRGEAKGATTTIGSHCGMGDEVFPLSCPNFTAWKLQQPTGVENRGGLRTLADNLLKEKSLVVPPCHNRLKEKKGESCDEKHPGYCVERDALLADRFQSIFSHLDNLVNQESCGFLYLRIRGQVDDAVKPTMFALLAYGVGRPKRFFEFLVADLTALVDDEHFTLRLRKVDAPAIDVPCAMSQHCSSMQHMSLWEGAVAAARLSPDAPISIEKCIEDVGEVLAEAKVHGIEVLIADATVLAEKAEVAGMAEGDDDALELLRKAKAKPRRKNQRQEVGRKVDVPWWMRELDEPAPKRIKRDIAKKKKVDLHI